MSLHVETCHDTGRAVANIGLALTMDTLAVDSHSLYRAVAAEVPDSTTLVHRTPSVDLDRTDHYTDHLCDLSSALDTMLDEMDTPVYIQHLLAPWVHDH